MGILGSTKQIKHKKKVVGNKGHKCELVQGGP